MKTNSKEKQKSVIIKVLGIYDPDQLNIKLPDKEDKILSSQDNNEIAESK